MTGSVIGRSEFTLAAFHGLTSDLTAAERGAVFERLPGPMKQQALADLDARINARADYRWREYVEWGR
jgi:hypothetical protein